MALRNVFAILLCIALIFTGTGFFLASTAQTVTSDEAVESVVTELFKRQLEERIGEDKVTGLENDSISCSEFNQSLREEEVEAPFDCQKIKQEGFSNLIEPKIGNLTDSEGVEKAQRLTGTAATFSGVLTLLILFAAIGLTKPKVKTLEYLGASSLVLGLVLLGLGFLASSGIDVIVQQVLNQAEQLENLKEVVLEAGPIAGQIQSLKIWGGSLILAGFLSLIIYRYRNSIKGFLSS
jgi:hypothetical protein